MTVPDARTGREYERGDAGPGRGPVTTAAREPAWLRARTLPQGAAFWLVAGVLFLLFFAAAAPSPLYGVYQSRWRFSATTLTAVFAAYAVLLLATLLVFGPAWRPGVLATLRPRVAVPRQVRGRSRGPCRA